MGEPLANYDRVWGAIGRLHGDMGLSARHLTLSTVGIVPGIRRLAAETLPVNLAVSLHAANDELRDELVPINRRYPLAALADACAEYVAASGRRLSIEWALIDGVNDRESDAVELAAFARPLGAHVNLIPLNPTRGYPVVGSSRARVRAFPRPPVVARGERHHPHHTGRGDRRCLWAAGRLAPGRVGAAAGAGAIAPWRSISIERSMARGKRSGVIRPSLFWFLLLDGGIVALTKLAVSKSAYDKVDDMVSLPPRETLQAMLLATAVIHATEAVVAGGMARRRGLPRGAGGCRPSWSASPRCASCAGPPSRPDATPVQTPGPGRYGAAMGGHGEGAATEGSGEAPPRKGSYFEELHVVLVVALVVICLALGIVGWMLHPDSNGSHPFRRTSGCWSRVPGMASSRP